MCAGSESYGRICHRSLQLCSSYWPIVASPQNSVPGKKKRLSMSEKHQGLYVVMTLPAAFLLLQQFTSPDMAYPVSLHACSYELACEKACNCIQLTHTPAVM